MPVISLAEASRERDQLRNQRRHLVFTNGHFELLHLGHLRYLEAARALGDALFVGVNGDQSTLRLKGRRSVIVPAAERAALVAALKPVTAVVIFEEDTAHSTIEVLRPELYVKGGDYSSQASKTPPKPLPEREVVEAYGGRVIFVDYLANHSTSARIAQIQSLHQ
ncbi:MAG: adenylyltransferase/cytidyltransferase family protein [Chloroflexi bacterium]|nr:adenylyltransferase/cytidyltransferase family protein [Chloroflexota bacterium]MCY4010415.1 adenylyltransferase/cytidyltransferase family protein [Anaerolineaceae bacterium]MCY4106935.1 adenylyltransferase/cytidyltransferase family protein [Chloroflexota bacterium]